MEPLQIQNSLGWKKWLMIFGTAVLAMVIWVYINSPMIVTVTGTGEVSVPATNALVSFTISANDSSPQNAINSVNGKAESMRIFLLTKGVAELDIAEGQVTAVPAGLVAQGAQGYQATISMGVKTVHVADISSLVSDLYLNGVTVVSQPILSVENQDDLENQAFESALNDAKKEAGGVGLKNWKFVRKIIAISQSTSSNTSTATTRPDTLTETGSTLAATNGVFKIVKAVSVTYKMW